MICANCKNEVADTSKFCKICGTRTLWSATAQPPTKTCPLCGAENSLSAKFCRVDDYRFEAQGPGAATVHSALSPKPATAEHMGSSATPTPSIDHPAPTLPSALAVDLERTLPPTITPTPQPASATAPVLSSGDVVLCPRCGTLNPVTAKFCRNDGALLVPDHAVSTAPRSETSASAMPVQQPLNKAMPLPELSPLPVSVAELRVESQRQTGKIPQATFASSKSTLAIVACAAALLLVIGGGSYWYLSGRAARTDKVAEMPQPSVAPSTVARATPIDRAPPSSSASPYAPDPATVTPAVTAQGLAHDKDMPSIVAETWQATVNQPGYGSYPAVMQLHQDQAGRSSGTIEYPSLQCVGSLVLFKTEKQVLWFRETIQQGQGKCQDGGLIAITPNSSGALGWQYFLPDDASSPLATATFTTSQGQGELRTPDQETAARRTLEQEAVEPRNAEQPTEKGVKFDTAQTDTASSKNTLLANQESMPQLSTAGIGNAKFGMTPDAVERALGRKLSFGEGMSNAQLKDVFCAPATITVLPGVQLFFSKGQFDGFSTDKPTVTTKSGFKVGDPEASIIKKFQTDPTYQRGENRHEGADLMEITIGRSDAVHGTVLMFSSRLGIVTAISAGQVLDGSDYCAQ